MTNRSPFSHEPDRELGQVLREALRVSNDPTFTDRVLEGFDEARRLGIPFVDVLATWSRAGVVAAMALAVAGLVMLRPGSAISDEAVRTIDEILAEDPIPAALAAPSPDPNIVLAVAVDAR